MILYSIIMPAYNSERTIKRAIDSILAQKEQNWELIIVDDGSTDSTKDVCDFYIKQDKRIKYLYQNNSGPGEARNNGIKHSSGEYICFLDSDDYWDLLFLECINNEISKKPYDIVFYDTVRENEFNKKVSYSCPSVFKKRTQRELLLLQCAGTLEWGMTKVVKRALISEHNILFSNNSVGEEATFSVEIIYYSSLIGFVDKPIYHYVDNSNGQHKKGNLDPWFDVVRKIDSLLLNFELVSDKEHNLAIKSLALKSLCINVSRICKEYKRKEAVRNIKLAIKKYKDNYQCIFRFKRKLLLRKIYLVGLSLKVHLYTLVYLLAR